MGQPLEIGLGKDDTETSHFFRTRLMRKEDTNTSTLRIERLTNSIHPLFAKSRFAEHEGFSPDHVVIEQPARLASRLLMCGVGDHILKRAALSSKPRRLLDLKSNEYNLQDDFGSDDVTAADSGPIALKLVYLAKHTEFVVDAAAGTGASTNQLDPVDVVLPECPEGSKSRIHIGRKMYDALVDAQDDAKGVPRLEVLQFEFAVVMLHESEHALHNLYRGKLDHEPYPGDSGTSERGYEMENALFGSHLARLFSHGDPSLPSSVVNYIHEDQKSKLVGIPVLWEYPYQGLVDEYREIGQHIPVRVMPKQERALDLARKVSITFLQRFFSDEFWERTFPKEGEEALRPPRTNAYCFRLNANAYRCPVKRSEEEEKYIPEGFHRLTHGDIVPDRKKSMARAKRKKKDLEDGDEDYQPRIRKRR